MEEKHATAPLAIRLIGPFDVCVNGRAATTPLA